MEWCMEARERKADPKSHHAVDRHLHQSLAWKGNSWLHLHVQDPYHAPRRAAPSLLVCGHADSEWDFQMGWVEHTQFISPESSVTQFTSPGYEVGCDGWLAHTISVVNVLLGAHERRWGVGNEAIFTNLRPVFCIHGDTYNQIGHDADTIPGGGNGYPLQYSCLWKPMDRGAWQATVHGVANSIQMNDQGINSWGCGQNSQPLMSSPRRSSDPQCYRKNENRQESAVVQSYCFAGRK